MRRRTIPSVLVLAAVVGFAAARSSRATPAQTTGRAAGESGRPSGGQAFTESDGCAEILRRNCAAEASAAANSGAPATLDANDLPRRNLAALRQLLQRAAATEGSDPALRGLGDFYAACTDVGAVAAAGREPLLPLLNKAGSVRNRETFFRFVAEFHAIGIEPLFRLRVEPDPDRPEREAAVLYPAELALPDPASYLDDRPESRALRGAFSAHVRQLFEFLGQTPTLAGVNADTVLRIETALARARRASGGSTSAKKVRRVPRAELEALTPGLTWRWYMLGSEIPAVPEFVVVDPDYFPAMAEAVTALRIEGMQTYLRWQILEHSAQLLPAAWADERAAFARIIGAASAPVLAREDQCALAAESALGDLLGTPFASRLLAKEGLESAASLVGAVRDSVLDSVSKVGWLSGAARSATLQRLSSMELLVGAPDPGTLPEPPALSRDRYAYNTFLAFNARFKKNVKRVGTAVNRRAWQVSAASSNLRYDALRNALTVPAGLLQPPYFDPAAGAASNYARLGAAVGAELILAIDRRGAERPERYGAEPSWPAPVAQAYARELKCVEDLGRTFTPSGATGEEPAELSAAVGGIRAAHRAWQRRRAGTGKPVKSDPADEREFFAAFIEARCPAASAAVPTASGTEPSGDSWKVGSHARVFVPLAASEEFGRAFACRPGSPVRPKQTCAIW